MTLLETLTAARQRLMDAGLSASDATADAELLARYVLGWDRAQILTRQREPAPPALEPQFSAWIDRRAKREPAAYIIGVREFWGLELEVTPAVLIPRPETELIVEAAIPLLASLSSPRVADIGTGSGCLAIAIAHTVPAAAVVASEISADALTVAHRNAVRHGVSDRVTFVRTSYLEGVDGQFDLIVANPPYVREADRPALSRDVRHEPEVALFGGMDGLRNVAGVLDTAGGALKPGGWLLTEFGYGQEDDVRALVQHRPAFRVERICEDLQGIARTAVMRRINNR